MSAESYELELARKLIAERPMLKGELEEIVEKITEGAGHDPDHEYSTLEGCLEGLLIFIDNNLTLQDLYEHKEEVLREWAQDNDYVEREY